jgi:predicted nucleotidyltransferase
MEDDCGLGKQAGGEILGQDRALGEVVGRVAEAYVPERVYLFGSKAPGDAGPDSDYGLMVIVPDDASAERRRSRLAYEALWGTGAAADVLVWSVREFQARTERWR